MTGFLWLLFLTFLSIRLNLRLFERYKHPFTGVLFATTLLTCLFSIWQLIGETIGVNTAFTLLPINYQSAVFGFARPTGFALEPQFLGSFLLIPLITSLGYLIKKDLSRHSRVTAWVIYGILVLSSFVITLTLSRGAYISAAIGVLTLTVLQRPKIKIILRTATPLTFSVLIALLTVGLSAQLNTRDTIEGAPAVTRSLNHISLGILNLPVTETATTETSTSNAPKPSLETAPQKTQAEQPTTSVGYVHESTSSRVLMTKEALRIWSSSPTNTIRGIGVGGFGAELSDEKPENSIKSIVNNQYAEILVETGLIGALLFVTLVLILPLIRLARNRQWPLLSLLIAISAQWLFFSGNINVFHLWLILALSYGPIQNYKTLVSKSSSTSAILY